MSGLLLLTGVGVSSGAAGPHPVAIIDLGTLGGVGSTARGMNEVGQVTGAARSGFSTFNPYVWEQGVMAPLSGVGMCCEGEGWEIAETGHAAGASVSADQPALWRDGVETPLGTLGGDSGRARALNDLDQVVGESEFEPGSLLIHAFFWEDGVMIDLHPPFSDDQSVAYDINNNSQIVGLASNPSGGTLAVLWEELVATDLGSLGGSVSVAYGINELHQIVGYSHEPSGFGQLFFRRAYLWENGEMRSIHFDSYFDSSRAIDINNLGMIIGEYDNGDLDERSPAVWLSPDGPSLHVARMLPPNSRWAPQWMFLEDLNDSGQIVGLGWHFQPERGAFEDRGFLITPVEHEFALSDVAPGIAGQVNGIRASGLEPGERVYFLYSQRGGGTVLPMCEILDATLQLDYPSVITSVRADANGEALLLVEVPAAARARGDILIQAVVPSSCKLSELRVVRFE
ncbi:MAG: hypothetical protein ACF8PN_07530 [Phycisphaerales bacterium]